jgi:hypothetical protein
VHYAQMKWFCFKKQTLGFHRPDKIECRILLTENDQT